MFFSFYDLNKVTTIFHLNKVKKIKGFDLKHVAEILFKIKYLFIFRKT